MALGDVAPGGRLALTAEYRAIQPGSAAHCVEVTAAGGIRANQCATTTVFSPMLEVNISQPPPAPVGSNVTFRVVVTNRSQAPAVGLTIRDRFGPGLEHAECKSPIERGLDNLAPGLSTYVDVTFRVTQPGRACHTVEVWGADGTRASGEGCVDVIETQPGPSGPPSEPQRMAPPGQPPAYGPPPGAEPGRRTEPGPAPETIIQPPPGSVPPGSVAPTNVPPANVPPPAVTLLSVKKTGPRNALADHLAEFTTTITNVGSQPAAKVRVVEQSDPVMPIETVSNGLRQRAPTGRGRSPSWPRGPASRSR